MKALVLFRLFSQSQSQQTGGNIQPQMHFNLTENQMGSGQKLKGITSRSWADILFHNDAKKRLKQYRVNLNK
ncbi:MAG TPA: hypothetical protein VE978_26625 [Chitinophagales bacterium]|nr:hypothetical protein [Chitinophagales bacterium]